MRNGGDKVYLALMRSSEVITARPPTSSGMSHAFSLLWTHPDDRKF